MKKYVLPAVCGLFVFTLSASAVPLPLLTLTEESSTVLTWSWSGGFVGSGTLPNLGIDHWAGDIATPANTVGTLVGFANWLEPAPESGLNTVIFTFGLSSLHLDVSSDLEGINGNADGTTITGPGYDIAFFDRGDQPGNTVPDTGGTLVILLISIGGLALYRRTQSPSLHQSCIEE